MGDIRANDEHLIISGDRVPVAAYQAIYHKLTSKVENLNQVFPDAYVIKIEDLIQLDRLLEQSIMQYPVQGQTSTCSVSLHENERFSPSSFEKFCLFNFGMNKPTSEISYQMDFFTALPVEIQEAREIVQRFKVSIVIDQDFVEENNSGLPFFLRGMIVGNNINLKVEYSDYNVGRNLQVTVQDWVASLEKTKVPLWISLIEKRADTLQTLVPRLMLASSLFGLAEWWRTRTSANMMFDGFKSLGVAFLFYIFAQVMVIAVYQQLAEAKPLTYICLTKGDRDRRSVMMTRRRAKSRVALGLITVIILTIPVNILSSYIFEYAFPK